MNYRYAQIDSYGICFSDSYLIAEVSTPDMVALPLDAPSTLGKRWNGASWEDPPQPEPTPQPRHISVGAFYDRFGAFKYPILADTNPAVKALIQDSSVRAYIDLARPDLPTGLQLLVDAGHAIDPTAILEAEIQPYELP